jgi:hypothetical protein
MGLRKTKISLLLVQHWPASDGQHDSQAERLETSQPVLVYTSGGEPVAPSNFCTPHTGQFPALPSSFPALCAILHVDRQEMTRAWCFRGWPCFRGSSVHPHEARGLDLNFQREGVLLWIRGEQAQRGSTKPWGTGALFSTGPGGGHQQGIRSDQPIIHGSQATPFLTVCLTTLTTKLCLPYFWKRLSVEMGFFSLSCVPPPTQMPRTVACLLLDFFAHHLISLRLGTQTPTYRLSSKD